MTLTSSRCSWTNSRLRALPLAYLCILDNHPSKTYGRSFLEKHFEGSRLTHACQSCSPIWLGFLLIRTGCPEGQVVDHAPARTPDRRTQRGR